MFFKTLQMLLTVSLIKWWLTASISRTVDKLLDEMADKMAEKMRDRNC